jgi:hypothetical protein
MFSVASSFEVDFTDTTCQDASCGSDLLQGQSEAIERGF